MLQLIAQRFAECLERIVKTQFYKSTQNTSSLDISNTGNTLLLNPFTDEQHFDAPHNLAGLPF